MGSAAASFNQIEKRFGGAVAVDSVTLTIEAGEVTALLGENGAGKTTLMRMLAGAERPDRGEITIGASSYTTVTPDQAARAGVAMVHQHFMLVPELTVAENLAIAERATPFVFSPATIRQQAFEAATSAGISIPSPDAYVRDLSTGEQSRVELVKALRRHPRILILDEPTSVLSPPEVDQLGVVVKQLADAGTAVVLITHKLPEAFMLAQRVVVLRNGRLVHDSPLFEVTPGTLAQLMIGDRRIEQMNVSTGKQGRPLLELRGVSSARFDGEALHDIDLTLHSSEVVAIVGVTGNGQRQLAQMLRGLTAWNGTIRLKERVVTAADLLTDDTLAHVPADRTHDGIFPDLSIAENVAVAADIHPSAVDDLVQHYRIRARDKRQKVGTLSGGNQQKVLLARELSREPVAVVAAEPTRGLDVESTAFVHARLAEAARRGAGVLLITSDLDEAMRLADRLHVMYRGRLTPPMARGVSTATLGAMMAGIA